MIWSLSGRGSCWLSGQLTSSKIEQKLERVKVKKKINENRWASSTKASTGANKARLGVAVVEQKESERYHGSGMRERIGCQEHARGFKDCLALLVPRFFWIPVHVVEAGCKFHALEYKLITPWSLAHMPGMVVSLTEAVLGDSQTDCVLNVNLLTIISVSYQQSAEPSVPTDRGYILENEFGND